MKYLKHIISIFLLSLVTILGVSPAAYAQKRSADSRNEKELREYKIKFLAQEMELTAEQQPKFVEVYTKMMTEKKNAFENAIALDNKVRNAKNASEADYNKASEAMAQAKIKDGEIDKKYEKEFRKFLSSKQIYKMKEAEEKFRQRLKKARKK